MWVGEATRGEAGPVGGELDHCRARTPRENWWILSPVGTGAPWKILLYF